MYQTFLGQSSYEFFISVAVAVTVIASLFLYPLKRKVIGLHAERIIFFVSRYNDKAGDIVAKILISFESFLMACLLVYASTLNSSFGNMVGTSTNYFATLFLIGPFWLTLSLILMINPLKQIDIATLLAPFYLFFTKIACFCQGCCWGIPWKYGLYNHHYDHPGNQVPVQLIEMFFVLVIFIFLLFYIKKSKPGKALPMYLILYSGTRFFYEFLSGSHPAVIGPFNMYHIFCVITILIGLLMLIFVKLFGDKISSYFDLQHEKFYIKQAQKEEEKASALAEAEVRETERKEKARIAREKAKARRKK